MLKAFLGTASYTAVLNEQDTLTDWLTFKHKSLANGNCQVAVNVTLSTVANKKSQEMILMLVLRAFVLSGLITKKWRDAKVSLWEIRIKKSINRSHSQVVYHNCFYFLPQLQQTISNCSLKSNASYRAITNINLAFNKKM